MFGNRQLNNKAMYTSGRLLVAGPVGKVKFAALYFLTGIDSVTACSKRNPSNKSVMLKGLILMNHGR